MHVEVCNVHVRIVYIYRHNYLYVGTSSAILHLSLMLQSCIIICVCVCRERIGNFKTEPPGLFRGRGDHPKQGRIKVRTHLGGVGGGGRSQSLLLL